MQSVESYEISKGRAWGGGWGRRGGATPATDGDDNREHVQAGAVPVIHSSTKQNPPDEGCISLNVMSTTKCKLVI